MVIPKTEGIKYIGSKLKILPYILEAIKDLDIVSILDGFSGSTRVSQAFAKSGYIVTSNDISIWSKVFATAYLLNKQRPSYYNEMIEHLNNVVPYYGWFSKHYGGREDEVKLPFQVKNTEKADAIRDEIDRMGLNEIEKSVALTSLILALDIVDNTLGHYVAYLSKWSKRSYKDLVLNVPNLFVNEKDNIVTQNDVFEIIKDKYFDLAYFDPPYGSNNNKMPASRVRYNSYYHIWTTLIKNDKPNLFGKANRREDSRDTVTNSVFEDFKKDKNGYFIAINAIKKLITETNSKYILLSYSSGGRASKREIFELLNNNGTILKAFEINYKKNVMSKMRWTNEWINSDGKHIEYLFLIEKNKNLKNNNN